MKALDNGGCFLHVMGGVMVNKKAQRHAIDVLLDDLKVGAKERRLFWHHYNGGSAVIGDICRELHTTPWTLLTKTLPNLKKKLATRGIDF